MNHQLLRLSFYLANAALLWDVCDCQYVDSAEGHAKKSIFPTTDAYRVNEFLDYFFEPVIETGELFQSAEGSYTCGVPSKYLLSTSGFELHSPFAPRHESGGLQVEYVESKYKEKWDNLMSSDNNDGWYYDAILDNNVAFWVTDLATFDGYNEDYVDRIYLKWEWQGKTYYSMIAHNKQYRVDMNQFELISDTFTNSDSSNINFIRSEPRAYIDNAHADYAGYCETNNVQMVEIGIRRAVSNVEENVDFYISTFKGSIIDVSSQVHSGKYIDANGNQVKYSHILLQSDDSFMVSFFERKGVKATFGDFTISQFENEMLESHRNVMVNPFCCVDRWYDLHYAIPLNDDVASVLVLDKIMKDKNQLYGVFTITKLDDSSGNSGMFWTIVEPNGQVVQLPGPEVTSDKVSVEFYVEPSAWDGQWCPQLNEDKFHDFTFGDEIATITYFNLGEISENDDDSSINVNGHVMKWNVLIILLSILAFGLIVCLYGLLAVYCGWCKCGVCNKNQKDKNKRSYTYQTFEEVDIHTATPETTVAVSAAT